MFDERKIDAYQSIKAPEALRNKVLSESQKYSVKKRSPTAALRRVSAAAACLILLLGISALVRNDPGGEVEIRLSGTPVTQEAVSLSPENDLLRMAEVGPVLVPLELTLTEEAVLRCGDGWLYVMEPDSQTVLSEGTNCTANGSVLLHWEIPQGDTAQTYEMTVSTESGSVSILLSYDMTAGCWMVSRSGES